jgi:hypothetical protein
MVELEQASDRGASALLPHVLAASPGVSHLGATAEGLSNSSGLHNSPGGHTSVSLNMLYWLELCIIFLKITAIRIRAHCSDCCYKTREPAQHDAAAGACHRDSMVD